MAEKYMLYVAGIFVAAKFILDFVSWIVKRYFRRTEEGHCKYHDSCIGEINKCMAEIKRRQERMEAHCEVATESYEKVNNHQRESIISLFEKVEELSKSAVGFQIGIENLLSAISEIKSDLKRSS